MSAWELLNRLESDLASCPPTVLITSSLGASNSEKTKDYPQIVGFFEKPITFENIRQIFHLVGKH
ncbi:hypothetical protein J0A68_16715 [Algoriphagus sp. H41]|uniref:Response regulatory domain-containing protein n=1 Tax=Algoriphagus oliviformis TaxID=2811231 RepID=A0ABS3C649_9BACT|nr:hypothetical protein [Algoriphagus oliviformis]MBN7812599.1 hypothetical protein [Algoriphagus oliviformis]